MSYQFWGNFLSTVCPTRLRPRPGPATKAVSQPPLPPPPAPGAPPAKNAPLCLSVCSSSEEPFREHGNINHARCWGLSSSGLQAGRGRPPRGPSLQESSSSPPREALHGIGGVSNCSHHEPIVGGLSGRLNVEGPGAQGGQGTAGYTRPTSRRGCVLCHHHGRPLSLVKAASWPSGGRGRAARSPRCGGRGSWLVATAGLR